MNDFETSKKIEVIDGGIRVDTWLSKQFHALSRRAAQGFVEQGHVRVNGRRITKSFLLQEGDFVELQKEPTARNWVPTANTELPLEVVYEDPAFVVINKPWNMPSCAISSTGTDALANLIVARFPECASLGAQNGDAGLLHRLDNDTSGLLIAARTVRAHKSLKNMQENSQIEKRYLALVRGSQEGRLAAPMTISVALAAKSKGAKKMAAVKQGLKAVTHIEEVTSMGPFAFVKVLIYKGRRHQIRVHLAQRGFPICGDPLYEGPSAPALERLFLHACGLKFFHPVTSAPIEVYCPLPNELQRVISSIGQD